MVGRSYIKSEQEIWGLREFERRGEEFEGGIIGDK